MWSFYSEEPIQMFGFECNWQLLMSIIWVAVQFPYLEREKFLITGNYCDRQAGHNDVPVFKEEGAPGYFTIVKWVMVVHRWVEKFSHSYLFYKRESLHTLAQDLVITEIAIQPYSISVGHGHLQHAGAAYKTPFNIRYHTYLAPKDMSIPDAVMQAYDYSFGVENETDDKKKNVLVRNPKSRSAWKDSNADVPGSAISGTSTLKSVVMRSQERRDEDEVSAFDEKIDQDEYGDVVINNIPEI